MGESSNQFRLFSIEPDQSQQLQKALYPIQKMLSFHHNWFFFSVILLFTQSNISLQAVLLNDNGIKSSVFLSPMFDMKPGSVVTRYYHNIDFPRGHIAVKRFNAEVVDKDGRPVPLHETYLHHWVMVRSYQRKESHHLRFSEFQAFEISDHVIVRNSGICQGNSLGQYFGLGSETRRTSTFVPDPYGIEVGNPAEIPDGYEERWILNVHAIDTRGVDDRLGCTECRCDLYNVTQDEYGHDLRPDYKGGLKCCYDKTQCRVREGFWSEKRELYLRYTVEWVDWDDSLVIPVKIYIFDVTDSLFNGRHNCRVEYDVPLCSNNACIHTKRTRVSIKNGGHLIYGVAHQHSGGAGSALYGQDGRVICDSKPSYGSGREAGNESDYIVGMSSCYPEPVGSVFIRDEETLTLETNYSSSKSREHTGVMGLFYILIAPNHTLPSLSWTHPLQMWGHRGGAVVVVVLVVVVVVVATVTVIRGKNARQGDGYESIS